MNSRKPTSPRTRKIISATTVTTLFAASGAQAGIILFNTPFTSDSSTKGDTFWNIDGVGGDDARLNNGSDPTNVWKALYSTGAAVFRPAATNASSEANLRAFATGAVIGPSANFDTTSSINLLHRPTNRTNVLFDSVTGFTSGDSSYIGFKFNPSGSLELYGWARITITEGSGYGTATIHEWAYEDTGASIQAGATSAVPEPAAAATGLGLLALGAAGLRRQRRRAAVA